MHHSASVCESRGGLSGSRPLLAASCAALFSVLAVVPIAGQSVVSATHSGSTEANKQNASTAVVNPLDSSVFTPEPTTKLGQQDAAATTEVAAYTSALSGGRHWMGMQGIGTVTYANGPTEFNATLSNRGNLSFRLDIQTPAGLESTRVQGRMGAVQLGTKPSTPIDPDTAILGIFPFEIVARAVPSAQNASLIDGGTVSSNGQSLHRITLELPAMSLSVTTKLPGTLPIDLYFDPTTHLLVKSVCNVLMPGGRRTPFLSVVTYSDYRTVGTSVVPFHYSESINGQPYRALQLTSVQLNPSLSADYFRFERSNQ